MELSEIVPEEYKDNAALKDIKDTDGLIKSFINAQELIGKKSLPTAEDSQEKWDETHSKLGWVANKAEYKVETGEEFKGLEPFKDKLVDIMHTNRLSVKQANQVAKQVAESLTGLTNQTAEEQNRTLQEITSKVDTILGDSKESTLQKTNGVIDKYLHPDLKDSFSQLDATTKSVFNTVVDNMMKEYGGEDYLAKGPQGGNSAPTVEEVNARTNEIEAKMKTLVSGSDEYNKLATEFMKLKNILT